MKTLEGLVKSEEGLRLKAYKDSEGIWTIGYGRNLEDVGISPSEAETLLENDCARARSDAERFWFFPNLDPVRQLVLLSMIFNMGLPRVQGFHRMIEALGKGDFKTAAEEMRNSLWAAQVKSRAEILAQWMETGIIPE